MHIVPKGRFLLHISGLITATLLALALSTIAIAADNPTDNPPTQADLRKLNEAISKVEKQLSSASSERETLQKALFNSEKQITELNTSIQSLDRQINEERTRLAELGERSSALESDRLEQQATIGRYLRSAWQNGQQEYLKLALNQEDIALSARNLHYYQYFNRARATKIEEFNSTLEEIKNISDEVAVTTASLEINQQELSGQKQSLEGSQTEREQQMAALDKILSQSGEELARLKQEREELTLLIEELNRSIASLTPTGPQEPFASMKGKLPWPVSGRLLNTFGSRHELGDVTWQGVNIQASAGTEVKAIHNGRVVFADWFGNSGLLLIIDHGDGFMSLYSQNQQLYRAVGDWVYAGDAVAAVGNTGGREDPALYFEIRQNGRSQDPVAWCQRR